MMKITFSLTCVATSSLLMASTPPMLPVGPPSASVAPVATVATTPSVVLILLDDLGIEGLDLGDGSNGYNLSRPAGDLEYARTPYLSALRAGTVDDSGGPDYGGILFRRAYANPLCSPSRAELMTGRYAFRTGFGGNPSKNRGNSLQLPGTEPMLPQLLMDHGIPSGLFGKWHLAGKGAPDYCDHPTAVAGFTSYRGHPGNNSRTLRGDTVGDFNHWNWDATHCGPAATGDVCTCSPTCCLHEESDWEARVVANEAYAWIQAQTSGPYFAYVSFNPPHVPRQLPPRMRLSPETRTRLRQLGFLQGEGLPDERCDLEIERRMLFQAMIEAIDREVEVFVERVRTLDPNTMFIVVGDNGSPGGMQPTCLNGTPVDLGKQRKSQVYELGTRVPLIVYGPLVPPNSGGYVRDDLVHIVDVWRTVADILGVDQTAVDTFLAGTSSDGQSFLSMIEDPVSGTGLRDYAYTEKFPIGVPHATLTTSAPQRAITRDFATGSITGWFKLVRNKVGAGYQDELYDLDNDPFERNDLRLGTLTTEETDAYNALLVEMESYYTGIDVPVCTAACQ